MVRKRHSKELKTRIALDAIKGQKTIAEVAFEYVVHAKQLSIWKKKLLEAAPDDLSGVKGEGTKKKEIECDVLYQRVSQFPIGLNLPYKKDRISGTSDSDKVKCIDTNDKELSNIQQCKLLQRALSSYYTAQVLPY